MPSELETAALRFRSQLLRQERQAASEMVRAYATAWAHVRDELAGLQAQINAARAAGLIPDTFQPRQPGGPVVSRTPGTFSPSWLWERDRLTALQRQIEAELRQFSALAGELTEAGQLQAVQAAQANSQALATQAARSAGAPELVGMFDRLPRDAVQDLVGFASDGSPLRRLFESLGPRVSQGVQDALVTAVATGIGPRETARLVRRQFGLGLTRALTIARTEQVRAYREASRRSYEANGDILDGWIWLSARDGRTCPSCWAMHGTRHPATQTLDDHPNGRCTMVPVVKGHDPNIPTGEELFKELPAGDQRRILGPAAHEAWLDGLVSLRPGDPNSVVGRKDDRVWGTMRYARSLRDIVGADTAAEYVALAAREATLSPNETDRLVRRLIRQGRSATPIEISQIVTRVSQAPFNQSLQPTGEVKGLTLQGRTVQPQDTSDWIHLVQRVLKDDQWAPTVTMAEYIADLQHAAQAADRLAIYQRRGGNVVLAIAPTASVVQPGQLGGTALPYLVVIYSADRGIIVSGYQASDLATITIPTDAIWLQH